MNSLSLFVLDVIGSGYFWESYVRENSSWWSERDTDGRGQFVRAWGVRFHLHAEGVTLERTMGAARLGPDKARQHKQGGHSNLHQLGFLLDIYNY